MYIANANTEKENENFVATTIYLAIVVQVFHNLAAWTLCRLPFGFMLTEKWIVITLDAFG